MADGQKYVGSKVKISTAEGDYEGVIQAVNPKNRKLVLKKGKLICLFSSPRWKMTIYSLFSNCILSKSEIPVFVE